MEHLTGSQEAQELIMIFLLLFSAASMGSHYITHHHSASCILQSVGFCEICLFISVFFFKVSVM